jgi:hypothetical protein
MPSLGSLGAIIASRSKTGAKRSQCFFISASKRCG